MMELLHASKRGDETRTRELITRDPSSVNRYDDEGFTPLLAAASKGHVNVIKILISAGADVNLADNEFGWTPLREATAKGHTKAMEVLLRAKADPNLAESDGFTPLHVAASRGDSDAVSLLLKANANAELRDKKDGQTSLDVAKKLGHHAVISLLEAHMKRQVAAAKSAAKCSQFGDFLATLGLEEHTAVFTNERIDMDVAGMLTEEDLQRLGIPMGDRKKLLRALKQNAGSATTASPLQAHQVSLSKSSPTRTKKDRSDSKSEKKRDKKSHDGTAKDSSVLSSNPVSVIGSQSASSVLASATSVPQTDGSVVPSNTLSSVQSPARKLEHTVDVIAAAKATHLVPYEALHVERKLGEGSFGVVNLVMDKRTCIHYAAKVLKVSVNGMDAAAKEEFLREAALLYNLRDKHVVSFTGLSQDPLNNLVLLSEYMPGGSLNVWLYKTRHYFTPQVKLRLAIEIASGISYLHARNVLHRDLKSDNIFVDEDGAHAKVGDLGLAKVRSSEASVAVSTVGTMIYMAPEMLRGEPYSSAADVYSFALVVYELYAAQRPFPLNWDFHTMKQRVASKGERPDLTTLTIPPILSDTLKRCWAMDATRRPPMKAVVESLRALLVT